MRHVRRRGTQNHFGLENALADSSAVDKGHAGTGLDRGSLPERKLFPEPSLALRY